MKQYLPENVPHDDWDLMGLRDHYLGWLIGPEDLHFTRGEPGGFGAGERGHRVEEQGG